MNGVLLVNLGSPASPTAADVKPYLDEFLMDEYVLDVPYLLRALLVRGLILRRRPERSAAAYARIWWDEGSPLIVITRRLRDRVRQRTKLPVAMAMRYGQPGIPEGLRELHDHGVTHALVMPLYPQHAMASTVTVNEHVEDTRKALFPAMRTTSVPAFYNRADYITCLAEHLRQQLDGVVWDHLLFSYHGIPERHIRKTDVTRSHCQINANCCRTPSPAHEFCYRHQCFETTRLVTAKLGIPEGKFSLSFQSRLAGDKWLEPYTDKTIDGMPARGIKHLAVVTPAFVADCLETLEEIGMEARDAFLAHGGETFTAIACLNDDDAWASVVAGWIDEWDAASAAPPSAPSAALPTMRPV